MAGSVFLLDIDSRTMWPDLYSYLHHENLEQGMYLAEQEMDPAPEPGGAISARHHRRWPRSSLS
ncbi:hypothetical protein [Mycobacterium sp. D16R24]|uniref:hypothetical protein n=1 Tax=Mycobacterium sp. D16R24 TaxID=1855656 RepID=UPI00111626E4|nr:hypothetical protein [Mycobacterium sp. D16R24]